MNRNSIFYSLAITFSFGFSLQAQENSIKNTKPFTTENLIQRIQILEQKIKDLESPQDEQYHVTQKNSDSKYRFGGYFIIQSSHLNSAEKYGTSFNQGEMKLITFVDFTEQWSGLAELEFLKKQDVTNENKKSRSWGSQQQKAALERAWVQFDGFKNFTMKTGIFLSAFGVINQIHQKPLLESTDKPLFLNHPDMIVKSLNGVSIQYQSENHFTTEAYAGTNPIENSPSVSGLHFSYLLPWNLEWRLGLSYQQSRRQNESLIYHAAGADIKIDWRKYQLTAEILATGVKQLGYYIQSSYRFQNYIVFYKFDFMDTNTEIITDDDLSRQSVGINYLIKENMRLKAEYFMYNYKLKLDSDGENKDYSKFAAELAFSF